MKVLRLTDVAPRQPRWPLLACTVAAIGVAAVVIGLGPPQQEHTRIVLLGPNAAAGIAPLMLALQRGAEPSVDIVAQPDGVRIDRRVGTDDKAVNESGPLLAAQAIARLNAARRLAAPRAPLPDMDRLTPELVAQRTGLQSARAEADRSAAAFSTALSDVMRDTAALQAIEAGPPQAAADAPMRKMLADLELRRIDLAARYTADYPGIAIADSEIAGLRAILAQAAHERPAHPQRAALATLTAERLRLETALQSETQLRDELTNRIAGLDRLISARLQPPASPPSPDSANLEATIVALPSTRSADPRPAAGGLIAAAAALVAWAGRRRARMPAPTGLAARIAAVEQAVELPVLRCLGVDGTVAAASGFTGDGLRQPRSDRTDRTGLRS